MQTPGDDFGRKYVFSGLARGALGWLTWAHLGLTWGSLGFLRLAWGNKNDENVVLEDIGSGASFLARGGGGWKAKVLLSCKRECKNTIHPEPVLCAPGTNFHTPKLMFAFSNVCMVFA